MKEITFGIHERGEKAHNGIEICPATLDLYFNGIYGTYNYLNQNIKISSTIEDIDKVAKVVDHEYLHYILHDEVSVKASIDLDNVDNRQNQLW